MAEPLRLDIERPVHGWATVRLTAPDATLQFAASYTPRDSISDVASAATGLAAGVPVHVVIWNTEPAEYEFRFATDGDWTRLEVWQFPDHRRQRAGGLATLVEGDAVTVARALWRGLRRLQGAMSAEDFAACWRHPFPAAAVERLGEQLRRQAAREAPDTETGAAADGGGR
jgi:hypothetical protein